MSKLYKDLMEGLTAMEEYLDGKRKLKTETLSQPTQNQPNGMDKELFNDLLFSIEQMKKHMRGEQITARIETLKRPT